MENLIAALSPWQLWVIVGIILCVLEMLTPGFFLMALGIGCFFAGAVSLFLGINWQIAMFIAISLVTFFVARKVLYGKKPETKFGVDALIGKTAIVIERVTADSGLVKVEGEKWPARSEDIIEEGVHVLIYAYEGNKLKVRSVN